MKYLFDTNICIFLINKKYEYLKDYVENVGIEEIAISMITIVELEYGIAKSATPYKQENRIALLEFLTPFKFLPFEQMDAYEYAQLRNDLRKSGNLIGNMDMLIGAQAVANDLILVTNNVKEFDRIKGIKIENWVREEDR
jgi:tRNA(fMet)-specific endonuclease VapC